MDSAAILYKTFHTFFSILGSACNYYFGIMLLKILAIGCVFTISQCMFLVWTPGACEDFVILYVLHGDNGVPVLLSTVPGCRCHLAGTFILLGVESSFLGGSHLKTNKQKKGFQTLISSYSTQVFNASFALCQNICNK